MAVAVGIVWIGVYGYFVPAAVPEEYVIAAAAQLWVSGWPSGDADPWSIPSGWRIGAHAPTVFRLAFSGGDAHVKITGTPGAATVVVDDGEPRTLTASTAAGAVTVVLGGRRTTFALACGGDALWLSGSAGTWSVRVVAEAAVREDDAHSGDAEITSPMPGSVIAVGLADGDDIQAGATVVVVEAMKMEHALTAPTDGTVELLVGVGDQVRVDQLLARVIHRIES